MNRKKVGLISGLLFSVFLFSCKSGSIATFSLSSTAISGKHEIGFDSGLKAAGRIDEIYTAKPGAKANRNSFPFTWKNLPSGTKYLALVYDDPDAKKIMAIFGMKGESFVHWLAADIDPSLKGLDGKASMGKNTFIQGKNSAGTIGYTGPQPPGNIPEGEKTPIIHVYRLELYALSSSTGLKEGFTLDDLKKAMKGKILGKAKLNMSYSN
jgi:Raf kinase inhibitor-like YbhB/YbcL family protein